MASVDRANIQRTLHDHIVTEILLRKKALEPNEDLFAAGFDSMSLSRLLVFVEETWGVVIPDQDVVIDEMSTLDKVTQFVADRIEKAQT